MLIDGLFTAGHERALLSLEDNEMQFEAATKIAADALSVRDTEKLIQKMKKPIKETVSEKNTTQMDVLYDSIEEKMRTIIGSKVSINRKSSGKGTIEIAYYSMEDLERIMDIFEKSKR